MGMNKIDLLQGTLDLLVNSSSCLSARSMLITWKWSLYSRNRSDSAHT